MVTGRQQQQIARLMVKAAAEVLVTQYLPHPGGVNQQYLRREAVSGHRQHTLARACLSLHLDVVTAV
jgi:hypothetical protein